MGTCDSPSGSAAATPARNMRFSRVPTLKFGDAPADRSLHRGLRETGPAMHYQGRRHRRVDRLQQIKVDRHLAGGDQVCVAD